MDTEEILVDPLTPSVWSSTTEFISLYGIDTFIYQYGWYILCVLVIIGIYWNRIQKKLDHWYDKRESRKEAAKYHKNPDLALERLQQIEKVRQRMQEELNRKALEHKEKMKERQQREAEEKLAKYEAQQGGHRLGTDRPSSSKGFKSDYNPLMGHSSSRYKPPKKGCPGGGCGGGK